MQQHHMQQHRLSTQTKQNIPDSGSMEAAGTGDQTELMKELRREKGEEFV